MHLAENFIPDSIVEACSWFSNAASSRSGARREVEITHVNLSKLAISFFPSSAHLYRTRRVEVLCAADVVNTSRSQQTSTVNNLTS